MFSVWLTAFGSFTLTPHRMESICSPKLKLGYSGWWSRSEMVEAQLLFTVMLTSYFADRCTMK